MVLLFRVTHLWLRSKMPRCGIYHGKLQYVTDIPHALWLCLLYGVISHILQNPYQNGKLVSNNKRLNQPTIIHLSNFDELLSPSLTPVSFNNHK